MIGNLAPTIQSSQRINFNILNGTIVASNAVHFDMGELELRPNNGSTKGLHWVNWGEVCRPKHQGCLGIRPLCQMNEALSIAHCLEKIMRDFLWPNNGSTKGLHWVNWGRSVSSEGSRMPRY